MEVLKIREKDGTRWLFPLAALAGIKEVGEKVDVTVKMGKKKHGEDVYTIFKDVAYYSTTQLNSESKRSEKRRNVNP